MLDNNGFVLGRIPTNGGGISKTYPESFMVIVEEDDFIVKSFTYGSSNYASKIYLNKNTNRL